MHTTIEQTPPDDASLEAWRRRVRAAAELGQLAFGGDPALAFEASSVPHHLAFLPAESLELDLSDPAQRNFGDYELMEKLGQGGMGVVYRARQHSLDREVAVKLLLAGPWASEDFIARFKREARHAARLNHPNIVAVHEVDSHEELNFFSMALVRGASLAAVLAKRGPLPPAESAKVLRTVAEALDYAHRLGVLHLDLKPGNVLIDERGEPMVADFGLARRLDQSLSLDAEEVSGTPSYMAPEQALLKSHRLSPATDIYGLGAILYECLTGRPPFIGPNPTETLKRVVTQEAVPPQRLNRKVPLDLAAICLKCLAKTPSDRYASARGLADDLGRFIDGRAVSVRPLSAVQRARRWVSREPRLAAAALLLFVTLVLGLAATGWQWRRAELSLVESEATNSLLSQVLTTADPSVELLSPLDPSAKADRANLTVKQLVHDLEKSLDSGEVFSRTPELMRLYRLQRAPEFEIGLRLTLAEIYFGTGDFDGAGRNLARVEKISDARLPQTHPQRLRARLDRAMVSGYSRFGESLSDLIAPLVALDPERLTDAQLRPVLSSYMIQSQLVLSTQGPDAAFGWMRRAADLSERRFGRADTDTWLLDTSAAAAAGYLGRRDWAIEFAQRAIASAEAMRAPYPAREIAARVALNAILIRIPERANEAVRLAEETHGRARAALGEDSVPALGAAQGLTDALSMMGEVARAESIYASIRAGYARLSVPEFVVRRSEIDRVRRLCQLDRCDEAVRLANELQPYFDQTGLKPEVDAAKAFALSLDGRPADALALARRAAEVFKLVFKDADPVLRNNIATPLIVTGLTDEAATLLRKVLSTEPNDAQAHFLLAQIALRSGDWSGARTQAAAATVHGQRPSEGLNGRHLLALAEAELRLGNAQRARELAVQAEGQLGKSIGAAHWWTRLARLTALIAAGHTQDEALVEIVEALHKERRPNTLEGQRAAALIRDYVPRFAARAEGS